MTRFQIRETLTFAATIEADTAEEAYEAYEHLFSPDLPEGVELVDSDFTVSALVDIRRRTPIGEES